MYSLKLLKSLILSPMKISKPCFLIVILLQQILIVNSAHIIIKRYIDDKPTLVKEPLEEKTNSETEGVETVEKHDGNSNNNLINVNKEEKSNTDDFKKKEEKSNTDDFKKKEEKSNNEQTNTNKEDDSNGGKTGKKQENASTEEHTFGKHEKSSNEETSKKDKSNNDNNNKNPPKDSTWGANAAAKSDVNAGMVFKPTKGKSEWQKADNDGTGTIDGGERNDEIPDFFADQA